MEGILEHDEERLMDVHKELLGQPVVVEMSGVSKSYQLEGGSIVPALHSIDISTASEFYPIRKGEFVMIRGPSGGGKTTLLNLIGTIDKPSTGKIRLFNSEVNYAKDNGLADLRLRKIGFVFQTFNLLATLSALENVELPMSVRGGGDRSSRVERAKMLLNEVGLGDRMAHLPSELSGGEQQRVTIARALSNNPDLLLLDEPTGDLDTRSTLDIMKVLMDINQSRNITCIMVTHNPDLECYAHRVLYVADGTFERQVLNLEQSPLDHDLYMSVLKTRDHHQGEEEEEEEEEEAKFE